MIEISPPTAEWKNGALGPRVSKNRRDITPVPSSAGSKFKRIPGGHWSYRLVELVDSRFSERSYPKK